MKKQNSEAKQGLRLSHWHSVKGFKAEGEQLVLESLSLWENMCHNLWLVMLQNSLHMSFYFPCSRRLEWELIYHPTINAMIRVLWEL